ncbi:hypothetical protein [Pseudomonas sp. 22 E 5]|nr:hypothetical protein [Pseudomonas sp. 22 E 5]
MPIAGITGWHHAIEHVHTAAHTLYEIFRFANAHKVTRFVSRHQARQVIQHLDHFVLGLTDRQAADGQAIKAYLVEAFERALAQAFVHTALDDTEQCSSVVAVCILRTLGPTQRQLHGNPRHVLVSRVRRAFVKDHHNVGTQVPLHLHRLFRPHEYFGAIYRRGEGHALLLDLAHGAQAEHLEAAGIGEDRALPFHEVVQVAVLLDHFRARAQPQVEGIAEDNFGAGGDDVARQHAFYGAVGTDRHERRGLYSAAREGQATSTGFAISCEQFKRHTTHSCSSGPRGAGLRVINIASP